MYKKVISILLVICIFISCFTFNTFAVDFPDDLKINGMDYVDYFEYAPRSDKFFCFCNLVDTVTTSYIEFITVSDVMIPSTNPISISVFKDSQEYIFWPNVEYIGVVERNGGYNYLTRYWFDLLVTMPTFDSFMINYYQFASNPSFVELYSLWFGSGPSFTNVSLDGVYQLNHGDLEGKVFTFGAAPSQTFVASDDIFELYIYPDQTDKKRYDFLEFDFMCAGVSITSVSVAYGDKILPVSYDNYINGDLSSDMHLIRCLLDLSVIDRNTAVTDINTIPTYLVVTGTCNIGDVIHFGSFGIDGFVVNTLPSGEVSWLKKVWHSVVDGFNSVIAALGGNSSQGQEFDNLMQDKLDQMQQANDALNSIDKPNPDTVGDISGIIDSSSSVAFSPVLSSLTGNDTFIQIMLLVVTFMLVGFVLFGKK